MKVYMVIASVELVATVVAIVLVHTDVISPGASVMIWFPVVVSAVSWVFAVRAQNRANFDAIVWRAEAEERVERSRATADPPCESRA